MQKIHKRPSGDADYIKIANKVLENNKKYIDSLSKNIKKTQVRCKKFLEKPLNVFKQYQFIDIRLVEINGDVEPLLVTNASIIPSVAKSKPALYCAVAYNNNSRRIILAESDGHINLLKWEKEIVQLKRINIDQDKMKILSVAISNDSSLCAVGLQSLNSGKILLQKINERDEFVNKDIIKGIQYKAGVTCVEFSKGDVYLISGSLDKTLNIYSVQNEEVFKIINLGFPIKYLARLILKNLPLPMEKIL